MGTRADFYVGRGENAEWLGSIAWDGYPSGLNDTLRPSSDSVEGWRQTVADTLSQRDDATLPEQGWPWPWDDSRTTDYAYAFDGGRVWGSCFGHAWFAIDPDAESFGEPSDEEWGAKVAFPDMSVRKNVRLDPGSGLIVATLSVPEDGTS